MDHSHHHQESDTNNMNNQNMNTNVADNSTESTIGMMVSYNFRILVIKNSK